MTLFGRDCLYCQRQTELAFVLLNKMQKSELCLTFFQSVVVSVTMLTAVPADADKYFGSEDLEQLAFARRATL